MFKADFFHQYLNAMAQNQHISKATAIVLVVALLGLIAVAVYFSTLPQNRGPTALYPGEVRDYQGQNLASIAAVYENAIKGTQYIDASTYRLTITGLVNKTVTYTYDQVLNDFPKYQKVVDIYCVEGWNATILWEGVLVGDLLKEAGVNSSAVGAIFYASDGYSTELPLDYLHNRNILLAYKMNNITMPPERGFPFELVSESQYGYKWIKWVTQIELTSNPNYLGYWESRGYPNNATLR
jgi:DMSO/TMAO reductase YedYZ molybdopterin-dependent catalytic subunit